MDATHYNMDATHSTNMYDFLLITVLVVDDFGEGIPVAWAVSDKEDNKSLRIFLKQLQVRTGPLKPKYFMSDDAQQYWNSWDSEYGDNGTDKLLCGWHVDRAWRKALQVNVRDDHERPIINCDSSC